MKLIKIALSVFLLFCFGFVHAQDDLMKELDTIKSDKKEVTSAAFKGLQIGNMQSTKLPVKGEFYFLVSHRFGDLTDGINNFFGLDNAYTKLGGIYGVTNWLSIGFSRHTHDKLYEVGFKYKLANQEDEGFPITIVGYNTIDANSSKLQTVYPDIKFENRLAFSNQLIISRKFSNSFSVEITPIFIHKNLYDVQLEAKKNTFLLGTGVRYKIAKRLSLNLDYAARLNIPEGYKSPYQNAATLGLDIETGGHVFQLVLSNSQAMNDVSYYTTGSGINGGKGIFFGFNMYRVF